MKRYSDADLAQAVLKSVSVAGVLRELGIRMAGGSHTHISRRIMSAQIDISHFLGQRVNSGPGHKGGPKKRSWDDILTLRDTQRERESVIRIRRALKEMGRDYRCEGCGNTGTWQEGGLVLQVDHKNGNAWDNRPDNLRFLCPNCHSQTPGWCHKH